MASRLSPRQREILDLVAAGRTSKEIAVTLGISESTVNWHLANAFSRLGASSRAEAVALSLRTDGNGALPEQRTSPYPAALPHQGALLLGRHFVAIAIAIALAGALVGGATVAALRGGFDLFPGASPSLTPIVTASPSGGSGTGESTAPSGTTATAAPAAPAFVPMELVPAEAPVTPAPPIPLPVSSAPPPAVPVLTPLPTTVLPAPLPTAVLPTPLPTAVLPTPLISPLPVPSLPPVPIATPSPPRLP
jgi:DNA-binding CsgD family transcriptional regulator